MSLFDDSTPAARPRPAPATPAVWSVTQLTRRIDAALKGFGRLAVEGEVSRPKVIASGHLFFTLKDDGATLDCKVWRSDLPRALAAPLEDGMRVVAHGTLDVYAPYGKHSLIVDRVEPRGLGALLAELERLKARLAEEGLFGRRRPLPPLPRRIGVVTSRDADAWRDFLRTRTLRWPLYPVVLAHSRVQGRGAAAEIAAAIRRLDAHGVDVIVVCRGGGALEDLWCFNEEVVARAIFECRTPVVTGVGHETDTTLVDLVADRRAHTPTDAAQSVIPERATFLAALERQGAYLDDALRRRLARAAEALERAAASRALRRPSDWLAPAARRVDDAGRGLARGARATVDRRASRAERLALRLAAQSPTARLARAAARFGELAARLDAASPRAGAERAMQRSDDLARRLGAAAEASLARLERRVELAARALAAVSPLAVLERGYSITRRLDGSVVRSASEAAPGEALETLLGRGRLRSTVTEVRP